MRLVATIMGVSTSGSGWSDRDAVVAQGCQDGARAGAEQRGDAARARSAPVQAGRALHVQSADRGAVHGGSPVTGAAQRPVAGRVGAVAAPAARFRALGGVGAVVGPERCGASAARAQRLGHRAPLGPYPAVRGGVTGLGPCPSRATGERVAVAAPPSVVRPAETPGPVRTRTAGDRAGTEVAGRRRSLTQTRQRRWGVHRWLRCIERCQAAASTYWAGLGSGRAPGLAAQ